MGMKLSGEQALAVWGQIVIHYAMNNHDFVALHNKLYAHSGSAEELMNQMLESGESAALTQLVNEMVIDRLV